MDWIWILTDASSIRLDWDSYEYFEDWTGFDWDFYGCFEVFQASGTLCQMTAEHWIRLDWMGIGTRKKKSVKSLDFWTLTRDSCGFFEALNEGDFKRQRPSFLFWLIT